MTPVNRKERVKLKYISKQDNKRLKLKYDLGQDGKGKAETGLIVLRKTLPKRLSEEGVGERWEKSNQSADRNLINKAKIEKLIYGRN